VFIFIYIYAAGRFNTPPTSRSSTTWIRYYTAAGFYCAFAAPAQQMTIQIHVCHQWR
jgi:hypothetical protein